MTGSDRDLEVEYYDLAVKRKVTKSMRAFVDVASDAIEDDTAAQSRSRLRAAASALVLALLNAIGTRFFVEQGALYGAADFETSPRDDRYSELRMRRRVAAWLDALRRSLDREAIALLRDIHTNERKTLVSTLFLCAFWFRQQVFSIVILAGVGALSYTLGAAQRESAAPRPCDVFITSTRACSGVPAGSEQDENICPYSEPEAPTSAVQTALGIPLARVCEPCRRRHGDCDDGRSTGTPGHTVTVTLVTPATPPNSNPPASGHDPVPPAPIVAPVPSDSPPPAPAPSWDSRTWPRPYMSPAITPLPPVIGGRVAIAAPLIPPRPYGGRTVAPETIASLDRPGPMTRYMEVKCYVPIR